MLRCKADSTTSFSLIIAAAAHGHVGDMIALASDQCVNKISARLLLSSLRVLTVVVRLSGLKLIVFFVSLLEYCELRQVLVINPFQFVSQHKTRDKKNGTIRTLFPPKAYSRCL